MTRLRMSDAQREQWRRELAAENAWESETPRRLVDLGAAIAIAAAVLDAVLTYAVLDGSIYLERNPAFARDEDRLARFTREAQTLAALNHPNIAHIHGLIDADGVRALVMELVEGHDLSVLINAGRVLTRAPVFPVTPPP